MKTYYNKEKDVFYYERHSMTWQIDEHHVFSGVPSEEQLHEWGFEKYVTPPAPEPSELDKRRMRMAEIEQELASMDYLTSKYIDGEDMSEYGDWQGKRKALREEYKKLESENA